MEITVKIKDSLITDLGVQHIKNFLQKQLQLYELQLSADKITGYIQQEENVNWEEELEKVREDAWQEYKTKFFDKK